MHFTWSLVKDLIDLETLSGALLFALFMALITWIACIATTRMLRRLNWCPCRISSIFGC